MIRRAILSAVAAVLFGVGLVVASPAAPAYALDICKDVPAPAPPKSGMAGLLTKTPDQPKTVDPFETPTVPIHEVYGASWHWSVYDLGCTKFSDIPAMTNTTSGNLIMQFAASGVAVLDVLERFARSTGVDWFADWIGQVTEAVKPIVFGGVGPAGPMVGLIALATIVAGAWIVTRAWAKADWAEAMRKAAVVAVCLVLAAWTVGVPGLASKSTDTLVTTAAAIGSTSFNASLTDGVNRNSLYRAWLAGQFGDPDSEVAKTNGPKIMKATHYTWAEWERAQNDPAYRKTLDEQKAALYKEVADDLKENHPSVYVAFQGKGERTGPAVFGFLSAGVMGLFAFVAFVTILFGRVIMQMLVVVAPVAAIAGMLPKGEGPLKRMWDLFVAAIVAVFKFTLAAGLMAALLGLLAKLDPVSAMLWMTIATIAALAILKPFHTFKTFMPGLDPNRSYLKDLGGLVSKLAIAGATGGVAGAATAAATSAGGPVQAGDLTVNQPGPQRVSLAVAQQPSPPPLPAPTFHQIEGTNRFVGSNYGAEPPAYGIPRQPLPAGPGGSGGAAAELPSGPGRVAGQHVQVEGSPRLVIDGPLNIPAGQGQVVISGEIVPEGGTYQRPTVAQQEPQPTLPPPDRDMGDGPAVGRVGVVPVTPCTLVCVTNRDTYWITD